jgi:Rieske Fe-S protein
VTDTSPAHDCACRARPDASRRAVLSGIGATIGLAACAGPAQSGATTSPGGPTSPSATGAGASTRTTGPEGTSRPGAVVLGRVRDVPVGGALVSQVEGTAVIVTQPREGEFVGLSSICSHRGCTVGLDGEQLRCPCHGSTFDLEGRATRGPASEPLARFTVLVEGENLVVG